MKQADFLDFNRARVEPATARVCIEFDGGTPCNIPRLGYGEGYGSFKLGSHGKIFRLKFGRPMSANAAEVWTLVEALRHVSKCWLPQRTDISISGDSKIALARCYRPLSKKKKKRDSNEFEDACAALTALCAQFHSVTTKWRGRAASVKLFGH